MPEGVDVSFQQHQGEYAGQVSAGEADALRYSWASAKPDTVASVKPNPAENVELNIPYEDKQAKLGKEWAIVYADENKPLVNSAEIVLRNPAVYARDLERHKLPENLNDEWKKLNDFADSLSTVAALKPTEWGNVNGLDRIQSMIFRGDINPVFRGAVGDIMKASSDLFSRSVKIVPGNTDYFKGNVVAAEAWIKDHRPLTSPPSAS